MIGFAHRGAPITSSEQNTLPAFRRALSMGARGLETDIGLTRDGVPVLIHRGFALRRDLDVSRLRRRELPEHVPSLADLYEQCGNNFELSLDLAEPKAVEAVMDVAASYHAAERLWLNYWRLPTLETWRRSWPNAHLVYATLPLGRNRVVRLITRLVDVQIDALNILHYACTPRLVEVAHHHDRCIFAWGIRNWCSLQRVVRHGVDGVYCDDVTTLVEVLQLQ